MFESDYAILVKFMLDSDTSMHPLDSIISNYITLMVKLSSISLKHIYRECNMVVDSLAKNSLSHEHGFVDFDAPPAYSTQAFFDDIDRSSGVRRTVVGPDSGPVG